MASPRSLHDPMVVPICVDVDQPIDIGFQENSLEYDVGIETAIQIINPTERYEGPYTVTPLAHSETVLETQDKYMDDDVTVLKIPYYETSNLSGGYTVFIAGEV